MGISELIEHCRRQQRQIPGQLEIPDPPVWRSWATEQEAMEEWRDRTFTIAKVRKPKFPLFDSDDPTLGEEISQLFGGA